MQYPKVAIKLGAMKYIDMTPIERYQLDLTRPDFKADAAQRVAIEKLQGVYDALLQQQQVPKASGMLARMKSKSRKPNFTKPTATFAP